MTGDWDMDRDGWIERIVLILDTIDTASLKMIYHFVVGVRERNRKLKK